MAFTETLKLTVKRKAHFSCCLCHSLGVEVHHIVPQAEGGPDTEDNAAPLCPSCHETYGANHQKRKFITDARDFWYEICEKRYASDIDQLNNIARAVQETATKDDLSRAVEQILDFQQSLSVLASQFIDREQYIRHIEQRAIEIEVELRTKSITLEEVSKRIAIMQMGAEIAQKIADDRGEDHLEQASSAYSQALGVLIELGKLKQDAFAEIFASGFADGPIPEDPMQKLLYYLSVELRSVIRLSTAINISSSVIPSLMEAYNGNPDQSARDLIEGLSTKMRNGELDSGELQHSKKIDIKLMTSDII